MIKTDFNQSLSLSIDFESIPTERVVNKMTETELTGINIAAIRGESVPVRAK